MKVKTEHEIELIRESSILVSKTLAEVGSIIKPGVTTQQLDAFAEEFIRDNGAIPGFKGYYDYPATLCTSVNEQVIHGIPSKNVVLKEGDIVSVDCGVLLNGYYGDSAFTFPVGEISADVEELLRVTKESLYKGIAAATSSNRIGDVSYAIQKHVEQYNFTVVREFVGHGIGQKMHEKPEVPNYGKSGSGKRLPKGLVICIEPMINKGTCKVVEEKDGWTIRTKDRLPSAHFELTVAITDGAADQLSTFSFIEQKLNIS